MDHIEGLLKEAKNAKSWPDRLRHILEVLAELERHHGKPTRREIEHAEFTLSTMELQAQDAECYAPMKPAMRTVLKRVIALRYRL